VACGQNAMVTILRLVLGGVLVALSLLAMVSFDWVSQFFLGLSPDGSITGYMMLLLQILVLLPHFGGHR